MPLPKNQKIALFGNTSYRLITGGTGSGDVNEAYSIPLVKGLEETGFQINQNAVNSYETYLVEEKKKQPKKQFFFMPDPPIAEMKITEEYATKMASQSDLAIFTIGRNSGEFKDRELSDFYLSDIEKANLKVISDIFHVKGKKVIAVLNIGGVIETASWRDLVDGILLAWQPGQEGGYSIADVLIGKVNPSGKLPMSFPMTYDDVPSAKCFPGVPAEKPDSVKYEEGIYVGYRYYLSQNLETAYEFGYGLSYTDFEYSKLKLSSIKFKKDITATITVKNSGTVAGKEIVQLYLTAPSEKLDKPKYELRAFAKTKLLKPGESEIIQLTLHPKDLVSFDESKDCWIAEKGKYNVLIGKSSEMIEAAASFKLKKELTLKK